MENKKNYQPKKEKPELKKAPDSPKRIPTKDGGDLISEAGAPAMSERMS